MSGSQSYFSPQSLEALRELSAQFLQSPVQDHASLAQAAAQAAGAGHITPLQAVDFMQKAPQDPAQIGAYVKQHFDAINARLAQNQGNQGSVTMPAHMQAQGLPMAAQQAQASASNPDLQRIQDQDQLRTNRAANWRMNQLMEQMPVGILGQNPLMQGGGE